MSWELVAVVVASFAFVACMTWLALPYVRRKSDHEKRIAALESATATLEDRTAKLNQAFDLSGRPMVRGLPGAVSR